IEIREMNDPGRLLADGLHDARMTMTERVYPQPRHEVEILLAFEVVKENTLPALKAHGIAVIGREKKALFKADDLVEAGHGFIVNGPDGEHLRGLRRGEPRFYSRHLALYNRDIAVETRLAASPPVVPGLSGSSNQFRGLCSIYSRTAFTEALDRRTWSCERETRQAASLLGSRCGLLRSQ